MNENEKLNVKKINEVVSISSKLLKIVYFVLVVLGLYACTIVIKEWQIFDILKNILLILTPLFIGIVVAWLLKPVIKYLEKKKVRKGISITAIFVALIALLYLLVASLIPILYEQVGDIANNLPAIFNDITRWVENFFDKFAASGIDFNATKSNLITKIGDLITDFATDLPNTLISLGSTIISGIGTFLIGLIIGIFLMLKPEGKSLIKYLPKKYQASTANLFNEINAIFRSFVNGTVILSTLVFVLCAIGFSLAGLKGAILFAFFCGITNVIPYIGPYIGAAPALLAGFAQSTGIGIVVLIIILIIQGIEGNLLQPIVMSRTMKLSPITVIVSLLIFGYLWGVVGMILSTPLVAALKAVFNYLNNKFHFIKYYE